MKGGIWFSLIDKVYAPTNLYASYAKVAANGGAAGVDHVTIEDFTKRLARNLEKLTAQLQDGSYRPQDVRRVNIPKPGTQETRPLGIPTVRDRVVQGALRHVLEPIFERQFAEHSYGFRPGRGCKDALRRVDRLLKGGCRYVVDVDLKSYFDTIPHAKLLDEVRKHVADSRVLALIESFLKAEILDGMRQWTPESGAPQGAVLSPLLSNLYLDELDHLVARSGYEMTRYADDLVIQCRTREEAERALALVQAWTTQAGLTLHPTKTKIVDAETDGFDFLGYRFVKHRRFVRQKSLMKFRDAIRAKTRRTAGREPERDHRRLSTALCGAGLNISNTATAPRSPTWTDGSACGCAAFCGSVMARKGVVISRIICAGPMPTLPDRGSSAWQKPMSWPVNPLGGKTINWRAGCGKSASPVRREGRPEPNRPSLPLSSLS